MGWRTLVPALMRRNSTRYARKCGPAAEYRPTFHGLTHDYNPIPPSSNHSFDSGQGIYHPLWHNGRISEHLSLNYGHQQLQAFQRISTFNPSFQVTSDGSEQPVRSPLLQAPSPPAGSTTLQAKSKVVRAVLKKINQSPKKVGLVAKLVRGMRADDALMQMTVLPKRAAKTVYKVLHSARANAVHNNGLDSARLIVAEAFVGKGVYLKRMWIHGRGKHGIRTRRTCRLTVVLKEMSPADEAELAKTRVVRFQEQRVHKAKVSKLFPHRLIETRWNRERNLIRKRSPLSLSRTIKNSHRSETN